MQGFNGPRFSLASAGGSGRKQEQLYKNPKIPKLDFNNLEPTPDPEEDSQTELKNKTLGTQVKLFGTKLLGFFSGDAIKEEKYFVDQYKALSARPEYGEYFSDYASDDLSNYKNMAT